MKSFLSWLYHKLGIEKDYHRGWRHCDEEIKIGTPLFRLEMWWEACSWNDEYDRGFADRLKKEIKDSDLL